MADEHALTPETPPRTHDAAIMELVKSLINEIARESADGYGDTPMDKLKFQVKERANPAMVGAIDALSTYAQARATDRMATAMESVAKTIKAQATETTVDTNAQAMVELRESKREYLSTTYRLDSVTLSLLWAIRGLLVDASIKSLSHPDRFDPYRRLSTEEIAYSLRLDPEEFWAVLPRNPRGGIDYRLLEEFDCLRYGGTDDRPDEWLYGG